MEADYDCGGVAAVAVAVVLVETTKLLVVVVADGVMLVATIKL